VLKFQSKVKFIDFVWELKEEFVSIPDMTLYPVKDELVLLTSTLFALIVSVKEESVFHTS
jgi:hypothetical protein